jgi:NAD(P)-dependent dehydrogenase (short-subunit alcohol dehydrogenase family)
MRRIGAGAQGQSVRPIPIDQSGSASKAALRHLTAIWAEEAKANGISFLSLDPGDMDTPLHALAVPDADPRTLKRPHDAAAEIVEALLGVLPDPITRRVAESR